MGLYWPSCPLEDIDNVFMATGAVVMTNLSVNFAIEAHEETVVFTFLCTRASISNSPKHKQSDIHFSLLEALDV